MSKARVIHRDQRSAQVRHLLRYIDGGEYKSARQMRAAFKPEVIRSAFDHGFIDVFDEDEDQPIMMTTRGGQLWLQSGDGLP